MIRKLLSLAIILVQLTTLDAQNVIKGLVSDVSNSDAIIGATLIIKGTTEGVVTDWDGTFELRTDTPLPFDLEVSYIGYTTKIINVASDKRLEIGLEEDVVTIDGVEVKASRISDKQKESPLTIEALDNIAIKETPAADFYDGLGALKGVDLTAASLGFKVVNTRGFNSTSPVRSLQIIDGVDNQAPGLNFSLGNFLGSSELDINKVELVVGASSAFYGPNAFNGVISMETKDPFFHEGLSAMVKVGERNMLKTAIRWADVVNNKEAHPFFAYKLNFEYLQADDWVANNFDPVDGTEIPVDNPGRVDGVNIYGDEYQRGNDFSDLPLSDPTGLLDVWHRTGYKEEDLVDYDTRNYKANAALHFRLSPSKREQSPELILATSYGSGTTVYQGDNRFSLKGITFLQNKVEFRKKNKFFLRAYSTQTTAGDSYDPYFTALQLQENSKGNTEWSKDYAAYWQDNIVPQVLESDFPKLVILRDDEGNILFDPETGAVLTDFDVDGANQWITDNNSLLTQWHNESAAFADGGAQTASSQAVPYFAPGTDRFDAEFDEITGELRGQGGTKFFDQSALYHIHGEYVFTPTWMDKITVGSNARWYRPESRGTVFSDTTGNVIKNSEIGFYTGVEKSLYENKIKLQGALRADKNQNFDWLLSPAGSIVYTPSPNNFFRASFSSAIRNPTLSDQYLYLDVGRAILSGNLDGVQNLVTIESVSDFFGAAIPNPALLDSFDIGAVRPEKVKTFEFGVRTTLFEKLYVDAGYYYSIYDDFLGFKIGIDLEYDIDNGPLTIQELQPFRYAANSDNRVTTQGLAIGLNYYVGKKYSIQGNYSWNKLNKTFADDPIIPAFNTPEHKFNIGFGGRKLKLPFGPRKNDFSFNVNYKWIEGFLFEGSPQFTGDIPTYDMLDAQVSYKFTKLNTTLKIGASNVLNNKRFQTYGGPRIGRLAYVSLTYEPK